MSLVRGGHTLVLCFLAGSAVINAEEPAPKAAAVGTPPRVWHARLDKGREEALRLGRPMLVRVGAEWCPWCRKLDQEVALPEVQKALGPWTLIALDADESADDVRGLGVGPIPALRVLDLTGRLVAERDGFLPAKDLVEWLEKNLAAAGDRPIGELTETGVPSAIAVVRLVRQFDRSDPLLREATIHRLLGYPDAAAVAVVDAFAKGSLQARLTALELLEAWRAPLDGIDPWRPQTLGEARLRGLKEWASSIARSGPSARPAASPQQVAAAAREIDVLLAADAASATAVRERIARVGRALLPRVYEALAKAETDAARERLTALRYRLAASDSLALSWPQGFDRLAATDVATRHRAVDELAERAPSGEEGLWLELFSDPDPLVRETALRGLDQAGAGPSDALLRLLEDPAPNVRAAVLKQLAEHPSAGLVPRLAEYVAKEKDPDLVVHAVRVLRSVPGKKGRKVLVGLLSHENWSVRAEVVEGVGKQIEHQTGTPDVEVADAITALIERLDDPDGFVAGRAFLALKGVDMPLIVEPVLKAAEKYPDLAAKAIETLSQGASTKQKALELAGKFAKHPRPDVRAATIKLLSDPATAAIEPVVQDALADPDSTVRIAAAQALQEKLNTLRTGVQAGSNVGAVTVFSGVLRGMFGKKEDTSESDAGARHEAWLKAFQEGKNQPLWMRPAATPLKTMLAARDPDERLAGALPLSALGSHPEAVTVLEEVARTRHNLVGEASQALPWRRWEDRLDLYRKLLNANPEEDDFHTLVQSLASVADPRIVPLLWELTARSGLSVRSGYAVAEALRNIELGPQTYNNEAIPKATKQRVLSQARPKAESGPEWQRVIALVLLAHVAVEDAAEVARVIIADPATPAALRHDAFRVVLLGEDRTKARALAIAALKPGDSTIRRLALEFLLGDLDHLRAVREGIWLPFPDVMQVSGNQPTLSALPKTLTPEVLRPLLAASDPETRALAGYALALTGEPEGVDLLIDYWRSHKEEGKWTKRVYQAIAQLNDDSKVSILEQVYAAARAQDPARQYWPDHIDVSDFYWTIRGMDGPNVAALRKRVRGEVGMEALRNDSNSPGIN